MGTRSTIRTLVVAAVVLSTLGCSQDDDERWFSDADFASAVSCRDLGERLGRALEDDIGVLGTGNIALIDAMDARLAVANSLAFELVVRGDHGCTVPDLVAEAEQHFTPSFHDHLAAIWGDGDEWDYDDWKRQLAVELDSVLSANLPDARLDATN